MGVMAAPVFLNSVAVIHSRRKRGNSDLAAESVYQHFHCADRQSKKQKGRTKLPAIKCHG